MVLSRVFPILSTFAAIFLSSINAQAQENINRRSIIFASYGERPGCPNGYLVGACTSGRYAHCPVAGKPNVFAFQAAICADITPQPQMMLQEIGNGISRWRFRKMAKCPAGQIAYYRCASGKRRDCRVDGRRRAHALWCRDPPQGMVLTDRTETVCGRYGEPVVCSPGYAVVESCGAGRWADCSFGECSRTRAWTQLKCQELIRPVETPAMLPLPQQQVFPLPAPASPEAPEYPENTKPIGVESSTYDDTTYPDEYVANPKDADPAETPKVASVKCKRRTRA